MVKYMLEAKEEESFKGVMQLLISLGTDNPKYTSLVHEEILSVFKRSESVQCTQLMAQTLNTLLKNIDPESDMFSPGKHEIFS